MKIIKYEKKGNGKYRLYLENNVKIDLYEDVILKNNLLYKKEINEDILNVIDNDNQKFDLYNRAIKYISVRVRSKKEIKDYLFKYTDDSVLVDNTIDKLVNNNLINDNEFARMFINDKFKFTTMGPYMIYQELKRHNINDEIIYKYLNTLDDEDVYEKMNKQIQKIIRSTKKKDGLRNKIYGNLMRLGYKQEMIIDGINKNL